MKGVVVKYFKTKGYGFISPMRREKSYLFFHIKDVVNADLVFKGQEVSYSVKKQYDNKDKAINIRAGEVPKDPYVYYGGTFFLIISLIFAIPNIFLDISLLTSYLIAINLTTFLAYWYDKIISHSSKIRVPENVLHILELLGGSIIALISQSYFRHKTKKESFKNVTKGILTLQFFIALIFILTLKI